MFKWVTLEVKSIDAQNVIGFVFSISLCEQRMFFTCKSNTWIHSYYKHFNNTHQVPFVHLLPEEAISLLWVLPDLSLEGYLSYSCCFKDKSWLLKRSIYLYSDENLLCNYGQASLSNFCQQFGLRFLFLEGGPSHFETVKIINLLMLQLATQKDTTF